IPKPVSRFRDDAQRMPARKSRRGKKRTNTSRPSPGGGGRRGGKSPPPPGGPAPAARPPLPPKNPAPGRVRAPHPTSAPPARIDLVAGTVAHRKPQSRHLDGLARDIGDAAFDDQHRYALVEFAGRSHVLEHETAEIDRQPDGAEQGRGLRNRADNLGAPDDEA